MVCQECHRPVVKGTEDRHRGSCGLCYRADHPNCVHVFGWVCQEDGCTKVIRPVSSSPVPRAAVNSHRKSHGLPPLDSLGHPHRNGSVGGSGGSNGSGGWLGELLEGIGDVIGSILD